MKFILVIVFLGSACKVSDASSIKDKEAGDQSVVPIVVVAGGFASCPNEGDLDELTRAGKTTEMYDLYFNRGLPGILKAKYGRAPSVLTVCYTGPSYLKNTATTMLEGRYTWNDGDLSPSKLGVKSYGVIQGGHLKDVSFLSHIKLFLKKFIDSNQADGKQTVLYFIGHSYGGFTSIHLASHFSDLVRGIVTIDPISMLECQAQTMVLRLDKTVRTRIPGCQRAPYDPLSASSTKKLTSMIAEQTGELWWLNLYQREFKFLRSGPIQGTAHGLESFLIHKDHFKSMVRGGDAHSQSARNQVVWDVIKMRFHQNVRP